MKFHSITLDYRILSLLHYVIKADRYFKGEYTCMKLMPLCNINSSVIASTKHRKVTI